MVRPTAPLLLCAALLTGLAPAARAADPLTLLTEDYPPFNWADQASGKTMGLSVDLVKELLARAGVAAKPVQVLPWARAQVLTATNAHTCMFSTARMPEREQSYQWIGPIARNEWVLFARDDDHLKLHSLEDARPYLIGTYLGDASVIWLQALKLKMSTVTSDRLNPPKLQMRRIQLWSVGRLSGLFQQRELGIGNFEAVLSFAQVDMYLACNKSMDTAEVGRLNELLRTMYRDGTVRRVYTQYGYQKETPRIDGAAR